MLSLLSAVAEHAPLNWADLGLRQGINFGFSVLGVPIILRYYSLAYIAGIVLGYWHLTRMVKAPGAPMAQRHAEDLFFYCTLGIILGGRLGYATFYTGGATGVPSMWLHPLEMLKLWDGGMSFHGGVLGTLAAIAFVAWRNKLSFIRVADYISVCVPFGMMFGRIANFVNGELWGRPAGPGVPWAMVFPSDQLHLARHPSQLYEAALEGALMILVMLLVFWKTRARYRPGLLVGVFTAGIATCRFIVEFFREPDQQLAQFARNSGLNMGQWLSLPMILLGIALVALALTRQPLGSAAKPAAK